MKKLILIVLTMCSVRYSDCQDNFCDPATTDYVNTYQMKDGAEWLKDFNVYAKKCCSEKSNEVVYTMVLTKNKNYRFVVKNSPKFAGKMELCLQDENGKIMFFEKTNDDDPKSFDVITDITCPYKLKITYPNGEEGCGAVAVYFVKDLGKGI